ncbi:MAG TPA: iron ABC transporter permease [Bacillota bacterium]|nr:iron ABC transporter permease [Bacillota bacterium]
MKRQISYPLMMVLFLCGLIAAFFISFLIGRYPIAIRTVEGIILSRFFSITAYWEGTLEKVVLHVRLPRILLAILVGGSLSMAGASYQTLFKNPMVSPDILGVSAGAGFGAALAMLQNGSWAGIQFFALTFGLLAVGLAYLIASLSGGRQNLTVLILAGIVTSSLFQSLLSVVKTLADTDNQLPSITFWLMGSLGKGNNDDVLIMLPVVAASAFVLFLFRSHIDALSAGEDEALSMGVNVPLVKIVVIVSSTLLTVVSVSICGIIGWVGMVVPHIARALTGASYGRLCSLSFLIGALFLLLIDNIIRGIPGVELPLGVMTALIGTPAFAVMLARIKRGW